MDEQFENLRDLIRREQTQRAYSNRPRPMWGKTAGWIAFIIFGALALASLSENHEDTSAPRRTSNEFICGTGHPSSCPKAEDEGPCASRPIISFDNGSSWQWDEGRCASREQTKRNSDAELSSYWPSTVRVDTDMDSFWLNKEERRCQTYPDMKGRVAVVACNASGSHRDHNIPVTFWGGVDRNTISDWRCQREDDKFVCRAIN